MNETKKFLDQQGVEYLWSKISMEDYPNNETLINVINAIDETKADRNELNSFVSVEPQELTDEQKAQARANIGAINTDYLCYQQPPIYRVDTSNEMIYKVYINLRDLEHGGYYYFNITTQIPENTAAVWMLYYVVVCDDGTECLVESTSGSNGVKISEPFFITNFTNSKGITTINYRTYDRFGSYITIKGTTDTASNLSRVVTYDYLSTYSNYEYTPTSDYNPATKKYVDDSVASIPQQIQADWAQTDETAKDFIKNKPEIATDEEIIEMLIAEDMFPVVTDTDGSLLADENGNVLLW